MKALIALVDGLSASYVLLPNYKFRLKFLEKFDSLLIRTKISYSMGLHTSMWTGLKQREHKIFTKYLFDLKQVKQNSNPIDIRRSKWLFSFYKNIAKMLILRKNTPHSIPPNLLKFLKPITTKKFPDPEFLRKMQLNTIFDNIEHEFIFFDTTYPDEIAKHLESRFSNIDVIFTLIGIVDRYGHVYGPNSKTIDLACEIIKALIRVSKKFNSKLFIFGDHGMVLTKNTIDLFKLLRKFSNANNLKIGRDYIPFLDSTMARILILEDSAKEKFDNLTYFMSKKGFLSKLKIISEENFHKYDIPEKLSDDLHYNNLIIALKQGYQIYPNFWFASLKHKLPKGMHGYNEETLDNMSILITTSDILKNSNSKSKIDSNIIDVEDIYKLLQRELLPP